MWVVWIWIWCCLFGFELWVWVCPVGCVFAGLDCAFGVVEL